MNEDTRKLESIKSAQESSKQLITLASAIITFLFGAIAVGNLELRGVSFWFGVLTSLLLVCSTLTGIITLFALSGILSSGTEMTKPDPLDSRNYKWAGRAQFFLFVGAIAGISVLVASWPPKPSGAKLEIAASAMLNCSLLDSRLVCENAKK